MCPYPSLDHVVTSKIHEEMDSSPSKELEMQEALNYINQVNQYPDMYPAFHQVLEDYRCQSINKLEAFNRASNLFAGHQDLLQGFKTFLAWENQIEYGTSNEPNTICATGDPVATNSNNDAMYSNPLLECDTGTLGFVEGVNQLSSANGGPSVSLHDWTDALVSVPATYADVQGAPALDYSIMRDYQENYEPNSAYVASVPRMPEPPMTMFISVRPPLFTRPLVALYPPLVVRVSDATMDLEIVSAFASLYRDGTDVTNLLKGTMDGIYSNGNFRFPDLKIAGKGFYEIKINLWHRNNHIGCVDGVLICVGDRPLQTNPIMDAHEIQHTRRQLFWQDIDDNVKDDDNGLFPNWNCKFHTALSSIVVGEVKYTKMMVLIPEYAFTRGKFDGRWYEITDEFGDGLFTDENGEWSDDGEVERAADRLDQSVHYGSDGELYRRKQGMFHDAYVALERRATFIGTITCIAHIVLLSTI